MPKRMSNLVRWECDYDGMHESKRGEYSSRDEIIAFHRESVAKGLEARADSAFWRGAFCGWVDAPSRDQLHRASRLLKHWAKAVREGRIEV